MGLFTKAAPLAAALAAAFVCNSAKATSVLYSEGLNDGTKVTMVSAPFSFTVSDVSSPYGAHSITQNGDSWTITFTPNSNFNSSSTTGMNVQLDGAIKFDLAFSSPINLFSIVVNEGGTWSTTGNGTKSVFAGGNISETDTIGEVLGKSNASATFNGANSGTWSDTVDFGGFTGTYSNYHISFDNILTTESLPGGEGSAFLGKDSFSVTINVPGGSGSIPATPLPLASLGGVVMGGAGLAAKRLRRK